MYLVLTHFSMTIGKKQESKPELDGESSKLKLHVKCLKRGGVLENWSSNFHYTSQKKNNQKNLTGYLLLDLMK